MHLYKNMNQEKVCLMKMQLKMTDYIWPMSFLFGLCLRMWYEKGTGSSQESPVFADAVQLFLIVFILWLILHHFSQSEQDLKTKVWKRRQYNQHKFNSTNKMLHHLLVMQSFQIQTSKTYISHIVYILPLSIYVYVPIYM